MHANNNGNLFATFLLLNEIQLLIFLVRGDPSKISDVQVVLISYITSCKEAHHIKDTSFCRDLFQGND